MNIVPNVNANLYTLSAIVIGFALIGDLNPAEQNSLGNWFFLVGQILCTNSSQQQVIDNRENIDSDTTNNIVNEDFSPERFDQILNTMRDQMENLKRTSNL